LMSTSSLGIVAAGDGTFSTTSAIYFTNASTSIPKTYSNNTFSGTNALATTSIFSLTGVTNGHVFVNGSYPYTLDAAGFNPAYSVCNAMGGGEIDFPSATVNINDNVVGRSNCVVRGVGNTATHFVIAAGVSIRNWNTSYTGFENVFFDGTAQNAFDVAVGNI